MKGLFWILALAGLAVAAALGARLNDGYLLLVIPPWRAEVSLNLFIIGEIAWRSKAGKTGTFVLFFVLAFGMVGFIAKSVIQKIWGI